MPLSALSSKRSSSATSAGAVVLPAEAWSIEEKDEVSEIALAVH
jgi:hypothetical protein